MSSLISTSSSSPFDPAYSYYSYSQVHSNELAQVEVRSEISVSTSFVPVDESQAASQPQINLVATRVIQAIDPLHDFDGFQMQDPNEHEGFGPIQQEKVVFKDVQPLEVLPSFSLSQYIKATWEAFKQEHKIALE